MMDVSKARHFSAKTIMTEQTTPRGEPQHRFPTDRPALVIERNKGRLNVLKLACLGLTATTHEHAASLLWILDDILSDLDRLELNLTTNTDVRGGDHAPV